MPQEPAKPEIVSMGFGAHNEARMSGQVLHGNTYKRARIIYIIPTTGPIPPKVYLSHRSIIFPPNQAMYPILALGHEVGEAYSRTLDMVLANEQLRDWEYVFSVESDNIVPPDGVVNLLKRMEEHPEFAAISGTYFCKGPQGCIHAWGDITDPVVNYRPVPVLPGELKEVYGLSMGMCLYRMSMFRDSRFPRPFFKTKAGRDGVGTQDLAFWGEARKLGYRCAVDGSVLVGHYDYEGKFGPPDFTW